MASNLARLLDSLRMQFGVVQPGDAIYDLGDTVEDFRKATSAAIDTQAFGVRALAAETVRHGWAGSQQS